MREDARDETAITFDLPEEHLTAVRQLAGERKVRLAGQVRGGRLVVDSVLFGAEGKNFPDGSFVAVNAPFKAAVAASA